MLVTSPQPGSIPITLVDEEGFEAWRQAQSPGWQCWLAANAFKAERHKVVLVPGTEGRVATAVLGLGKRCGPGQLSLWQISGLPERLPDGAYHLDAPLSPAAATQFALGWLYGQYRFDRYRRAPAARDLKLLAPSGVDVADVTRIHAACSLARDLINTPAGDLTPAALAAAVLDLGRRFSADCRHYEGQALIDHGFPAVHAVGRASSVAPQLVDFEWGDRTHPRITLVGKGVCFDSGGLDVKPAQGMLLMKKDMGGAACTLALAQLIMDAALPVRLRVIIPAVENAISGNAFRPGDVLSTRKGFTVEVGNTDAEGRLVLCDGLALADADEPDLIVDMATLTGAARVALGPELPALFASDEALSAELVRTGAAEFDPMWALPLWPGYDDELSSKIADLNNVSSSGFSGAIIGALFLKRFVTRAKAWVHLDLYAWNGKDRPGRPVGAEAQCVRTLYACLKARYAATHER